MLYAAPNQPGSKVQFKSRYANYIGGEWCAPVKGQYFQNITPVTGRPFCEIPRSTAEDIERALDAAHAAKARWGRTSPGDRASVLLKIADRVEQNLETLAVAETWDNGKPVRVSGRPPSFSLRGSATASPSMACRMRPGHARTALLRPAWRSCVVESLRLSILRWRRRAYA